MSICKIGETKVINGKRYRKEAVSPGEVCGRCAFISGDGCALFALGMKYQRISIEGGGRECSGSVWILDDDQHEAPTATPPRDKVREQRRFQAAVAAMQGMLANATLTDIDYSNTWDWVAKNATIQADKLISELDRTGAGK